MLDTASRRPVPNSDASGEVGVVYLFLGIAARRTRFHRPLRPSERCRGQLGGRTADFATSINSRVTSRHFGWRGVVGGVVRAPVWLNCPLRWKAEADRRPATLISVLAELALLHAYWGLGGRWPGHDDASLVERVIGRTESMRAPPPKACFTVAAALFAAAALVGLHVSRWPTSTAAWWVVTRRASGARHSCSWPAA